MGLITKLFGTYSERELKQIYPIVDKIEALEPTYQRMTDQELAAKTGEFKGKIQGGETLDNILPEAFATVREAAVRVLGQRPYRVQLIGGIVLHQGRIAEMKTGEGKTLVATLPAYLNALAGKGVHIVSVNDYLVKYGCESVGKIFRFLGLTVGMIIHDMDSAQRKKAYDADITYGTNNELGFDYLRDNMAKRKEDQVQRGHSFAIVDEVDSILIDEARTPLIISGAGSKPAELYVMANQFVRSLKKEVIAESDAKQTEASDIDADYIVEEKIRNATLTAKGVAKAEAFFRVKNLSDPENSVISHHINQAIRAYGVMKRDIDYVVKEGEVIIVDEFTGRLMFGRRYSNGLHQAVEAKENVPIAKENKTLATITFQNYFRLYSKLSGMTGTAVTESEEFGSIYQLDIVEIPTNRPVIRVDNHDSVYKTGGGKYQAIIEQVKRCHEKGQPVLIGTVSIEKNEHLSRLLKKEGIPHNVLNAKNHEREAAIVAQAGKLGAVTVATNMAGRGTDIMLGGNAEFLAKNDLAEAGVPEEVIAEAVGYADTTDTTILEARAQYKVFLEKRKAEIAPEAEKVRAAGGLFIIGTERHDSRRIDNQLRGRAGRQGDPGESRFYLSLDDDLLRLFGGERIASLMDKLDIDDSDPIENKMLTKSIQNAQISVESRHFQARKNTLEYDDVMNKQREIIYKERQQVLDGENIQTVIIRMVNGVVANKVRTAFSQDARMSADTWNDFCLSLQTIFFRGQDGLFSSVVAMKEQDALNFFKDKVMAEYNALERRLTPGLMRELERVVLLGVVDEYWMEHIDAMQELRQGIQLRAYAQKNPVDAYKEESLDMFEWMIGAIQEDAVAKIFSAKIILKNQA